LNPSHRTTRAVVVALAVAVALASTACVGNGKTPRTDSIEPLPGPMTVVTDAVDGCRDGESGFDYRFVVVGPADTRQNGRFAQHLGTRDFVRTPLVNKDDGWTTDDLPWAEIGFQHRVYPLRAEVGRLDSYLDDPVPHTGPPVDSIPQEVRDDPGDYVIVALRPTDFQCQTPL
jgi:hypothetical protein